MRPTRTLATAACSALLLTGVGLAAATAPASAATTVTTVDDELVVDGDCSLREAIEANNAGAPYDACLPSSVIDLPAGTYPVQMTLDVQEGTTLQGAGAEATELVCTSVVTCIVNSSTGGALEVADLTMSDVQGEFLVGLVGAGPLTVARSVLDGSDDGAIDVNNSPVHVVDSQLLDYVTTGIEVQDGQIDVVRSVLDAPANVGIATPFSPVLVDHSTIRGHLGHAVATEIADVQVVASTIEGNGDHAIVTGSGGVAVRSSTVAGNGGHGVTTISGDLSIEWSTIVDNAGRAFSYSGDSTTTVTGSIFANGMENCDNPLISGGFNVSDDGWCATWFTQPSDQNDTDPQLGPLADNGGLTATYLPSATSPAIDVGGTCAVADQRDQARPADGDADGDARCDSGAVEVAAVAPPVEDSEPTTTSTTTPAPTTTAPSPRRPGVDAPVVARPTFTG